MVFRLQKPQFQCCHHAKGEDEFIWTPKHQVTNRLLLYPSINNFKKKHGFVRPSSWRMMFSKIQQIQTPALFRGKASMFFTKRIAVKSGRLDGRSHKWSQYVYVCYG